MRRVSVATLLIGIVGVSCWGGYADASNRDHQRIRRLERRLEAVNERSWQAFMRANTMVRCVALSQPVTSNPGEPLIDASDPSLVPVGAHVYLVPIVSEDCWKLIMDPRLFRRNYTMPTGDVYP